MNIKNITEIQDQALQEVEAASDADALEAVRIRYLGRKGLLPDLMKQLKDVEPAQRPEAGKRLNELKNAFQERFEARKTELE